MEAAVVHLAELAALCGLCCGDVPCIIDHHVVNAEGQPFLLCERLHLLRVGDRCGDGLLDNHMLAGLERGACERGVGGIVGGDVHAVNRFVGKNLVKRTIPLEAKGLRRCLAGWIHIHCSDKLRRLQRLETVLVARVAFLGDAVLGDSAESNNNIFHLGHYQSSLNVPEALRSASL